jgi:hypothetical protein
MIQEFEKTSTDAKLLEQPMKSSTLEALRERTRGDAFWSRYIEEFATEQPLSVSVHLGIFVEPFLGFVLDGRKSVESRFSQMQCAPYNKVKDGDILLLKKSGGPVVGLCQISMAWCYHMDTDTLGELRDEFADALCAQDPEFWESKSSAEYATLMRLSNVLELKPIPFEKRDKRGWVVLEKRSRQMVLWNK